MSVSFTDEDQNVMRGKGYEADRSELGYVYYPNEGVTIPENIIVNYIEHPWITCFEVEGIEIVKKKRESV